jgi:hypothetical protein
MNELLARFTHAYIGRQDIPFRYVLEDEYMPVWSRIASYRYWIITSVE